MNLRGAGNFIHRPKYEKASIKFESFVDTAIEGNKKLVCIEVGAGYNTPTVTRFPMEAIVRKAVKVNGEDYKTLIRINPSDNDVPRDLPCLGIERDQ